LTLLQPIHIVYELGVAGFARGLEKAAIFSGACFDRLSTRILKAPVKGLFAGDGAVIPNGASDMIPYFGRKRAPGESSFLDVDINYC
jgi:hypothetical protein